MPFKDTLNFWKNLTQKRQIPNLKSNNIILNRSSDNIKNMILKTTLLTGGHFIIKKIISSFTWGTILLTVLETAAFQSKIYLPIWNLTNSCIDKISNVWVPIENKPLLTIGTQSPVDNVLETTVEAFSVGALEAASIVAEEINWKPTSEIITLVTGTDIVVTPMWVTGGYYLITGSIILLVLGPAGVLGTATGIAVTKGTTVALGYAGVTGIVAKSIGVTAGMITSVFSYKIVKDYINSNPNENENKFENENDSKIE